MTPIYFKILIQNIKNFVKESDLLKLRLINKQHKKQINSIIKQNQHLHFKLRCSKNLFMIDPITIEKNDLRNMIDLSQQFYSELSSFDYVRKNKTKFDEFFSNHDHVLTFEKHKLCHWYQDFDFIELFVMIDEDNDEYEFNIYDNHTSRNLIEMLHNDPKIINISLGKKLVDMFSAKIYEAIIDKKFLSDGWYYQEDDVIVCKLFWWYRKLSLMPANGTILQRLILDDDNEITEVIKCDILDDWLIDEKGKRFRRNDWCSNGFDKIPWFVNPSPVIGN